MKGCFEKTEPPKPQFEPCQHVLEPLHIYMVTSNVNKKRREESLFID